MEFNNKVVKQYFECNICSSKFEVPLPSDMIEKVIEAKQVNCFLCGSNDVKTTNNPTIN